LKENPEILLEIENKIREHHNLPLATKLTKDESQNNISETDDKINE